MQNSIDKFQDNFRELKAIMQKYNSLSNKFKSVIKFVFQSRNSLSNDKIYQHQTNLKIAKNQIAELEKELQKFKVIVSFSDLL